MSTLRIRTVYSVEEFRLSQANHSMEIKIWTDFYSKKYLRINGTYISNQ